MRRLLAVVRRLRDPRLTKLNHFFFWLTVGAFAVAVMLEARGNWGNLARHAFLHAYVLVVARRRAGRR